jgi:Carbohydrate-selective porin, OprB family
MLDKQRKMPQYCYSHYCLKIFFIGKIIFKNIAKWGSLNLIISLGLLPTVANPQPLYTENAKKLVSIDQSTLPTPLYWQHPNQKVRISPIFATSINSYYSTPVLNSIQRKFKKSYNIYSQQKFNLIASGLNRQIFDVKSQKISEEDLEESKVRVSLTKDTQFIIGINDLQARDFADPLNPLNEENEISLFGSRSSLYNLVGGSGVGVRHRFANNLEGSLGVLFSSSSNDLSDSDSRGIINEKINNENLSNFQENSGSNNLLRGSLSGNYGTLAQLTYAPSQNTKIGLTYIYGYDISSNLGSDFATETSGVNSAFGLQTSWQINPNFALGGWIGLHQNTNTDLNKNILSWALTASISKLAGTDNSAGIVVGQEPRVIIASELEEQDIGSSWHLEGFYQFKINDNFSIIPSVIFLTGSNPDVINSDSSSVIGFVRAKFEF